MKAYKKYGDIYRLTRQVRMLMRTKPHGDNDGLRKFWADKIKYGVDHKEFDYVYDYCAMFYLLIVLENGPQLWAWKMFVLAHRLSYHIN